MVKPKNLAAMSLNALMKLRDDVTEMLEKQAVAIQEQLARLTDLGAGSTSGHTPRPSKLRGRTVPVKYRDKNGNTWSGRGAQPRWMTVAIKAGAKRDDFLVEKVAKAPAKKAKKSTKKARPAKTRTLAKKAAKKAKRARPAKKAIARPKAKASKPAKRSSPRTRAKTEVAKQVNQPIPQPQPKIDDAPASAGPQ